MFTDVRGFTALSETLPPEEVTEIMNKALTVQVECVQKRGGMVDKFIGDAMMAIFNAPMDLENHEEKAVKTAIEMQEAIKELNKELPHEIAIGVGINTGEAVIGNMGSDTRFDYSAIGDAVNTAARLESATKEAGADIVGGDDFIEKIKGGEMNFEKLICTPGMMVKLSKLGKVLGPKGLMPNPKLGSVSDNIKEAVTNAKSGQVEIRNDKDGNIGVSIGKKSFSDDQLMKNYNAILETLEKEKSNNTLKGDLIKNVFATSTMGVSYKVKLGKSI